MLTKKKKRKKGKEKKNHCIKKAWFKRATQMQMQAACVCVLPSSHVENVGANSNASK